MVLYIFLPQAVLKHRKRYFCRVACKIIFILHKQNVQKGFTKTDICVKILRQLKRKLANRIWRNTQEAEGAPLLRV